MIQINVALPNPHSELLTLLPSCTLQDVETTAQAFWKKCRRLITATNRVIVDPDKNLRRSGECLAALVPQPQLAATHSTFALWCRGDGPIVTWGDPRCGSDSAPVRDQLKSVVQIQASNAAFAAILEDGSVVAWGHADIGGDNSLVRDQLKSVVQIQATNVACAAILEDGSVVTWGHADIGGGQFGSSRSAQECRADSSHKCCLCCDSARWIRRCLGS